MDLTNKLKPGIKYKIKHTSYLFCCVPTFGPMKWTPGVFPGRGRYHNPDQHWEEGHEGDVFYHDDAQATNQGNEVQLSEHPCGFHGYVRASSANTFLEMRLEVGDIPVANLS